MHIEMARKVVEHYHKFPIPVEKTEAKDEWINFEKPFSLTDEEGEVLSELMPYPEHIDDIAERLGRGKNELVPLLDGLLHKCYVVRSGTKEDGCYRAQTLYVGSVEMQEKFFSQELEDLRISHGAEIIEAVFGTPEMQPWFRVLPHEEAIPHDMAVFPSELFSHIVEHAGDTGLAVFDCHCRKSAKRQGRGCDSPRDDICMAFGPYAATGIENGAFRAVTKDEMLKIYKRVRDAGLVQQACACEHTILICNCCSCCCGVLSLWTLGLSQAMLKSNFLANFNWELCNGCRSCIKACRVQAITLDRKNLKPVLNLEKCIGCGLCVVACPTKNAVNLKRKEEVVKYLHSFDEVLRLRAEQSRRTELYQAYKGQEML